MQRGQTERERERDIKFYNTGSDLPADVTMYYFSRAMALIDMNPLIKMKNNKCIQQIKLGVFFYSIEQKWKWYVFKKKFICSSWIFPNNEMGFIVKYECILICGIW